jgi:sporulation-control protein spo0M
MKKSILISLLFLLLSTSLVKGQAALLVLIFGEKAATENFHFSLKLGVNYAIIHGLEEGDNAASFNFGLVNNIRLTERLTLVPEFIALAPRQMKNVPVITTGNPDLDDLLVEVESADRRLGYIDIPVLLKYHVNDRFSVSAGPQISFLTRATETYKSVPIEDVRLTTEVDIKSAVNKFDVGATLDLMYILVQPKGGKGVNLFLRYTKGFMDLSKDTESEKHTSSMIQLGATFPFVEKK